MDVMMIRCVGKIQPVRPNVANEDVCGDVTMCIWTSRNEFERSNEDSRVMRLP